MKEKTPIGNPGGFGSNHDYDRKRAAEIIEVYKREVGNIDFGNEIAERLFRNYLAEHASGADNMRGYFAAFSRRPLSPSAAPLH